MLAASEDGESETAVVQSMMGSQVTLTKPLQYMHKDEVVGNTSQTSAPTVTLASCSGSIQLAGLLQNCSVCMTRKATLVYRHKQIVFSCGNTQAREPAAGYHCALSFPPLEMRLAAVKPL